MALSANADNQNATTSRVLNKINYALANVAEDIGTATTSDITLFLDATDNYELKYGDSANVFEHMGITATAAELNAAADVSGRIVSVTDADTAISASNSGKPHLVANVSADRTFTLPTAASGLDFEFIATVVAADGHDWLIDTGSDTNYFLGSIVHMDTDADAAGDEIVVVAPDGNSNSILQINVPEGGTRVRVTCDGTNWVVSGVAVSATAPSFADQA